MKRTTYRLIMDGRGSKKYKEFDDFTDTNNSIYLFFPHSFRSTTYY